MRAGRCDVPVQRRAAAAAAQRAAVDAQLSDASLDVGRLRARVERGGDISYRDARGNSALHAPFE